MFAWVRLGVIRFVRVLVGSVERVKTSSGSLGFPCVNSGGPRGGRVNSGSRGLTGVRLSVVWFIRVRVGLLGCS